MGFREEKSKVISDDGYCVQFLGYKLIYCDGSRNTTIATEPLQTIPIYIESLKTWEETGNPITDEEKKQIIKNIEKVAHFLKTDLEIVKSNSGISIDEYTEQINQQGYNYTTKKKKDGVLFRPRKKWWQFWIES